MNEKNIVQLKSVTIIVPVYKDWNTLECCIQSLHRYVSEKHKILLINDRSEEWKELEKKIINTIEGYKNFFYYLNEENLGFVKTCNRAVFELDKTDNDILLLNSDTEVTEGFLEEMMQVLYAAEKHGVVCPRSNNATLLTIPVKNDLGRAVTAEESYRIFQQVKSLLPRQQVMPTGVGFAFLIKRTLIQSYGLFDEIYSPGYNEENDFCMRINEYGFNVLMANYAYVFHHESKSFGSDKKKLDEKHAEILTQRYPYYWDRVKLYFDKQMGEIDYFSDFISEEIYSKKRLLISLYELPAAYNGTAQHGLLFLESFYNLYKDKYSISILINSAANEFFGVSQSYPHVYLPEQLHERFHIAYVPSQIIHIEHLHILNRTCLKFAFCMQDIISIRSSYLLVDDWEREVVFSKSIAYCNGIIPFSQFSLDDMKDYYKGLFDDRTIYTKVVYLASADKITDNKTGSANYAIPFEKFFLVLGNQYKHKYLEKIRTYLKRSKYNFIIVGTKENGLILENVFGYKSGALSEEFMNHLFRKAVGIVFPSVYEGFGLPILSAITYKKKIIVNDNPLNREQRFCLNQYQNNILLTKDNMNLEENDFEKKLDEIYQNPFPVEKNSINRTWRDVAVEVENALNDILSQPLDCSLLKSRWADMRYLENVHRCYIPIETVNVNMKFKIRKKLIGMIKSHLPLGYRMLKKVRDEIKKDGNQWS